MTTIACTSEAMAGDGRVSSTPPENLCHFDNAVKVKRLGDLIIGTVGSAYDFEKFCAWLADKPDSIPELSSKFEALVLHKDGTILCFNRNCDSIPHTAPAAIGSGAAVAYGAMFMGANARDAVRAASRYDLATGGLITSVAIVED